MPTGKNVVLGSEKSTAEEKAKESDAKNKQILKAKNAQIKSLKTQVVVADQEAQEVGCIPGKGRGNQHSFTKDN